MTSRKRNRKGTAMMEYAGALVVFVCFLLIPLIDITMIPVRHFFACGAITELGYRLGHCRKRSEAYTMLNHDAWWKHSLDVFGITVSDSKLTLVACGHNASDTARFTQAQTVPAEWLPNGAKGPCVYSMNLSVDIRMNPIYLSKVGLPGFNTPVAFNICSRSAWENLGRDPNTTEYYINE